MILFPGQVPPEGGLTVGDVVASRPFRQTRIRDLHYSIATKVDDQGFLVWEDLPGCPDHEALERWVFVQCASYQTRR